MPKQVTLIGHLLLLLLTVHGPLQMMKTELKSQLTHANKMMLLCCLSILYMCIPISILFWIKNQTNFIFSPQHTDLLAGRTYHGSGACLCLKPGYTETLCDLYNSIIYNVMITTMIWSLMCTVSTATIRIIYYSCATRQIGRYQVAEHWSVSRCNISVLLGIPRGSVHCLGSMKLADRLLLKYSCEFLIWLQRPFYWILDIFCMP